jgi:hypothetical protein
MPNQRAEAEDILQEGFVKVFQGLDGFRQDAKLETWMTRIMVNTALNHHRKKLYLFPDGGYGEGRSALTMKVVSQGFTFQSC